MEDVEQDLRFLYVKYFTCYNSLLKVALERVGKPEYVRIIPNIPLSLKSVGLLGR